MQKRKNMTENQIREIFEKFNNRNVLVIGDVMIDAYIEGKVNRISPEAPVPVISAVKRENRLGGAANVALNIKSLGAEPILCSVIGEDKKGEIFKSLLQDQNLTDVGIVADTSRCTTTKTRIISSGQHLLRVDEEEESNLNEAVEGVFLNRIEEIINTSEVHAIIFEDYDKGVITKQIIDEVVKIATKKSIPTLVDPKKRNYNYYRGVTVFKPNFKEFTEGINKTITPGDYDTITTEGEKFLKESNNEVLLLTLSEYGIFICNHKDKATIPAEIRDINDVSGAGDTVISVASLCYSSKLPLASVAAISNMAGGLVCEKPGVVPVNKEQLLSECIKKLCSDD